MCLTPGEMARSLHAEAEDAAFCIETKCDEMIIKQH